MTFYTYDLETMLNFFSFAGKFLGSDEVFTFEISPRKNQRTELLSHLSYIQNTGAYMVGFNSIGFDYPILHELLTNPYAFDFQKAKELCDKIIGAQNYGSVPMNRIRLNDRVIPQIDLVKINHFDNNARRTSLKALQFAMRSESVEDLPYDPNKPLTSEQMDEMLKYNPHDVTETEKFLVRCMPLIELRKDLLDTGVLGGDVLNYSDVKIGTEYLIKKIGRAKCFVSGSKPRQTPRQIIAFKNIILPKIEYRTEPFQAVHEWFKTKQLNVVNRESIKLETKLGGVDFVFGVGGVHASVESKYFESDDDHVILDIDVTGMYPSVAIANGFAPEHLGRDFSVAYAQLKADRQQHAKGTTLNATLKLAGNAAFGNGNNQYSCFYDPKFPFSITVNGQLQLIQLAELLSLIPQLEIIQANTDGVTVRLPRNLVYLFRMWCGEWEKMTGLKLEEAEYKRMWIRDVNNYAAEYTDGKMKRKGAYWYPENDKEYEGWWNKDFSMMVVPKAIDLVHRFGYSPEDIVRSFSDPFDFMLRYKTTKGAKVYIGETEMLKTVRYYMSNQGEKMIKKAQPKGKIGDYKRKNRLTDDQYYNIKKSLPEGAWDERIHTKNKSKYKIVVTGIQAGQLVRECNVASRFNWVDLDYDFYVNEIKKLVIGDQHV